MEKSPVLGKQNVDSKSIKLRYNQSINKLLHHNINASFTNLSGIEVALCTTAIQHTQSHVIIRVRAPPVPVLRHPTFGESIMTVRTSAKYKCTVCALLILNVVMVCMYVAVFLIHDHTINFQMQACAHRNTHRHARAHTALYTSFSRVYDNINIVYDYFTLFY